MTIKSKLLSGLCLSACLFVSVGAEAHSNVTQVWRDSDGLIVYNSWDQCVRSDDVVGYDPCSPGVAPAAVRTVIGEEERTVYFEFNKATLTPEGMDRLNALADRLTSADDITGAKIVGYADRIGTSSYNKKLSQKRAEAVRAYLVQRHFVKPSSTETRWVGKSEPTANCPKKEAHVKLVECLQPDRKVVVEISYRAQTQASITTNQMAGDQQ